MITESGAFFALDLGSATTSATLLARLGDKWRLLAHQAVPAFRDPDELLFDMLGRLVAADPGLVAEMAGDRSSDPAVLAATLPRLVARSTPPRRLAVLAGSRQELGHLLGVALRAGWAVSGGSSDEDDPVALASIALSVRADALLLGADRTPIGDTKRQLPDLAALAASARRLRPELTVILAGGAAAFEAGVEEDPRNDERLATASLAGPPAADEGAGGMRAASFADQTLAEAAPLGPQVLLAPDADAGEPAGTALGLVLEGLRALPGDSRLGIVRSAASLAAVLARTVEVVEVGLGGGLRTLARPPALVRPELSWQHWCPADASFSPPDPTDDAVDSVAAWLTSPLDRHRLIDRLLDLRLTPWGDAEGEGAIVRLAAAKGALARLMAATKDQVEPAMPELLVAAGGIFASLPPGVVALALADVVRRPGIGQIACDARLLGPLGVLEDETERRVLLADLAEQMLLPLGALAMAAGIRPGRAAGTLRIGSAECQDLRSGTLVVLDLPPGRTEPLELDFRDSVNLGTRGKRFVRDVTGGLCGLLVDLRDIPIRLPDRVETRRAVLDGLELDMWPERDS